MLLTKKQGASAGAASSSFVHSLRRGLSQALPTLDRRSFLRRSGLGVGVGLAASQLSLVQKAHAAAGVDNIGKGKVEVKRTICTHCSVGCAVDAVVETASGSARKRCSTRPSTWVPTAPRALPCASTAMANTACATP
jgi:formate dehydrogenase major subunit